MTLRKSIKKVKSEAKHYGSQKSEGQNNQNQSLPTLSLDIGWLFSLKKFQIHLHIFHTICKIV